MIRVKTSGSFKGMEQFAARIKRREQYAKLRQYADEGVRALAAATPVDKNLTAQSWTYTIVEKSGSYTVNWRNTHVEDGRPIAILLEYGHGTRNGGYVQGHDYIMPAIRPIFDQMAAEMWKVVTK